MSRKPNNILELQESIRVVDWLKENWEKRVVANKMTAQDIADAVSHEKAIEKVTPGNIYGVLEKVFPQWQLPRVPKHLNMDARNFEARMGELENLVEQLQERVQHLEKELGVRPLTSFLSQQARNANRA